MLILKRGPREALCIGHDVKVTVLGVHGQHVRLGIRAPKHIPVHREEIYLAIQAEEKGLPRAGTRRRPR